MNEVETTDEELMPVAIWACERTGAVSTRIVGGECPVHGGDACIARYDHYTALERLSASRERYRKHLAEVLSGIQTTSGQQVFITGDHFALTVEDASQALTEGLE